MKGKPLCAFPFVLTVDWQYVWQIPGYEDRVALPRQAPLIPSPHKQTSPAISGHFVSSLLWSSHSRRENQRAICWVIMGRASLPSAIRLPPSISDSEAPVVQTLCWGWSHWRLSDRPHRKGAATVTVPMPHSNRHSESGSPTQGQALVLGPVFKRRAGAARVPPIYATCFLDGRQIEYSLSTDCAQVFGQALSLCYLIKSSQQNWVGLLLSY